MRVALAQITPAADPARNLDLAERTVREAAAHGARLVVLPEATLAPFGTDLAAAARTHADAFAGLLADLAAQLDLLVIAGSFRPAPDGRVHNVLEIHGPGVDARYAKIHLFDAFGSRESETVAPGDELVTVDLDGIGIGVATCYDVRFPEQFTALADRGAQIVVLPLAWGDGPGKEDQLRLLLRARALDATVLLLAADQAPPPGAPGRHPRGVGRSAAIGPRGEVLGELGRAEGLLVLDVDPAAVAEARLTLPVLRHRVPLPRPPRAGR